MVDYNMTCSFCVLVKKYKYVKFFGLFIWCALGNQFLTRNHT